MPRVPIKIPITINGLNELRQELERLKNVERPRIAKSISEARLHGDLRENAEYYSAREHQGFIEARIRDIESKLSNVNIIDVSRLPRSGIAVFGTTVHVLNVETGVESFYKLVGDDEANIKLNKISIFSPIARSIVGKRIGDIALATTPSGVFNLKIIKIEYV